MNAWIFDVDGVITNPQEKIISDVRLLDELIKRLKKKDIIALNTGRSLAWLRKNIIALLEKRLDDKNESRSLLNNFFVVGEKGACWILDGNDKKDVDILIPTSL